ncbi:NUDIX domain-containing protein [Gluconobacter oxydans]|uniref:NUDIX domain-containing protein n=2 Tax=Gluconobacter oxydans TaxID=442 RepID=A0AB35AJQ8_GLUOY|nr:thiamine pyrophosphokinase [Gluconobacter oxydans]MBF0855092.1 NUDIX domain-containing protein [Gluconobacter oxydans]
MHATYCSVSDKSFPPALEPFLRHIAACNSAVLPGGRLPFFCGSEQIGWVSPTTAQALQSLGLQKDQGFGVNAGTELLPLSQTLCDMGLYASHEEAFDVRNDSGVVLGQVDRGAIPVLGLAAEGVHLNGLVEREDGLFLWVARRSMSKRLDPGKLDHLVAGGMSAGLDPQTTVIKEAQEEAGIPTELAATARAVSRIEYALERPEGLRRDVLHCYDLLLPQGFTPIAEDGEVESFYLLPIQEVVALVRDTDAFKFNVNLVLIDLFIRRGLFAPAEAAILQNALTGRTA